MLEKIAIIHLNKDLLYMNTFIKLFDSAMVFALTGLHCIALHYKFHLLIIFSNIIPSAGLRN